MDETIDTLVEKIKNSLSGWSWVDQAYMFTEIAERLKIESHECLAIEYGLTED
jgi:hypothetical protein